MTEHEDYEGLAAGYALHALEPEDEQLLAVHLLTCPSCARLVADTAALGAAMATLVTPEPTPPPPADLRARLLAAVAAEPREPGPEPKVDPSREPSGVPAGSEVGAGASSPRPLRRLRRSRIAVGVLAAIIGIGVAVPVTLAVSDNGRSPSTTSALAQALLQSGAREVTLHADGSSAVAKAVMSDKGLVLVAKGLPVNDADRSIYVLWAANIDGVRTSVATFDVSTGAPVLVSSSKMPVKAADITQVAISHEDGRKAPAAPTDVVLSGSTA